MEQFQKRLMALLLALLLLLPAGVLEEEEEGRPVVCIAVKGYGEIYAQLYPEYAPITVENFLTLAGEHFYDGLTFHRIIAGFMIQGGDPLGNGTGGSSRQIKGEFSANGVENPLTHVRGVLSMARSGQMDSASSQFFIMHDDSPHLNGNYAAFGSVLSGQWIVDRICQETPVQDSNGTVLREHQPVIETVRAASWAEAREAMEKEAGRGLGGQVYPDLVSPLSFPLPEGWSLAEETPYTLEFQYGSDEDADGTRLMIARRNNWDGLSDSYKEQLRQSGYNREDMDTAVFSRSGLVGMTGQDESLFAEETRSGVLFYTAECAVNGAKAVYYVGANDGFVYLFAFNGGREDARFGDVLGILDQLTFRETY